MFNNIRSFFVRVRKDIVYLLIIANIIVWAIAYATSKPFAMEYINLDLEPVEAAEGVEVATATATPSQPIVYDKEWALKEVAAAGLDPVKVKCLVKHESGWNANARNVNKDGSVDLGVFQWNSKWQIDPGFISLGCIGNLECEVGKFIEKAKADGNFNAWHGFTKNCAWLEE